MHFAYINQVKHYKDKNIKKMLEFILKFRICNLLILNKIETGSFMTLH